MTSITKVGEYELLFPLANGGMGSVYMAKKHDDLFAAKLIHMKPSTNKIPGLESGQNIDRLIGMQHPNVVRTIEAFSDGAFWVVIMEYLPNGTLRSFIDVHSPLSEEQISKIFNQICKAITYIHSEGIIHGDIKPDNFLFDAKGNLVLADFGISKDSSVTQDLTQTSTASGSLRYMTPEHLLNQGLQKASDHYAAGVILWELITGQKIYHEIEDSYTIVNEIVSSKLPKTDTHWDGLIHNLTQKDILSRGNCIDYFGDQETTINNPNYKEYSIISIVFIGLLYLVFHLYSNESSKKANDGGVTEDYGKSLQDTLIVKLGSSDNWIVKQSNGVYFFYDKESNSLPFSTTYDKAKPFSNGLAAVMSNGRWGYIDTNGIVKIKPQYVWAGKFDKYGFAPVSQKDRYGLIDKKGASRVRIHFTNVILLENGTYKFEALNPDSYNGFIFDPQKMSQRINTGPSF